MKKKNILRVSGTFSIVSSIFFILSVFFLGLLQPGYDHRIDTISVLVLGKWGWIQHLNFLILAVGFISLGVGLSIVLIGKLRSVISISLSIVGILVILLSIFSADPVDRTRVTLTRLNSLEGAIHFSLTGLLILGTIPLVTSLVRAMKTHKDFRKYIRYTQAVLFINIIGGAVWFIFRRFGILFEWKGLFQKLLAVNVLMWMIRIGLLCVTVSSNQKNNTIRRNKRKNNSAKRKTKRG